MNPRRAFLASVAVAAGLACTPADHAPGARPTAATRDTPARSGALSTSEFRALMKTVADGLNEGDSRKAANCFTEDAIYMEPPDAQVYEGRESLYEFFGGKEQPPSPGRMIWHHVLFDEAEQIGAVEYTYQGNNRYHGMLMVRVVSGKIARWREYQRRSVLDWKDFTGKGGF